MKQKILILALALALSLGVVGVTLANGSAERPRWMLGGGASDAAVTGGGDVTMRATLGQPVVGGISGGGGNVTLGQGFWGRATPRYSVFLSLVLRGP